MTQGDRFDSPRYNPKKSPEESQGESYTSFSRGCVKGVRSLPYPECPFVYEVMFFLGRVYRNFIEGKDSKVTKNKSTPSILERLANTQWMK